ncbi:type II secretion system F family protein [Paraburkholderia bonniea]|uniref:type II secretion system F family protein n=1 Tax=Paraburkholderia bonniea TaxID=2152891 RepID=UPI0012925FD3|nr:type II secretion system F family protein [Paraburkholderia bonniea]WJF91286.1 type II secretion system F family protein [Paraburkholderia bonniea]WJF94601.1 type II secretion system F family protein [Paraburkholderia bonniea]
MSSAIALLGTLALLCVAGALLLLQRGAQRQERVSAERFVDSRMAAAPGLAAQGVHGAQGAHGVQASALSASAQPLRAPARGAGGQARWNYVQALVAARFTQLASRAGLAHARMLLLGVSISTLLLCFWAVQQGGWLAGGVMLLACSGLSYMLVTWRIQKRRQMIVRQLPSFLDGIVRLIVLGNSVPAAFQASLQSTEAPLRECLDHVSRMLRLGTEIDRALAHVALVYRISEFDLIGAVLRLSVKYGGRADVMLDRMASFMRDLEQAERELTAMSTETRLSAWVLALLPIGIGGFLIVSNPAYFGVMWHDDTGRLLVYLAFALQIAGAFLLYRLARLKGN